MSEQNHNHGDGLATDRRTVLKASGLAAGATALGVAAESVVAQDGAEHYMFASDVHLGSPFSNAGKFEEFLNNEVPSVDPDVLVLNGDVFEMWFRGMSATLLQYTNIASTVEEIHQNGTEVVLTAGNHDRRLITIGEQVPDAVTPGAPWQIGNDFFFESGGRSFVATHGDSGDPLQVNPLSNLLCATSDSTGGLLVDLYNWFTGTDSGTAVGSAGPETVTTTDPEWQTTTFDGSDSDSVVLTSPVESTDGPPVQARVKHGYSTASWNPNSVDIRVESWTPFGRVDDPDQTVHCAVLETGRHAIGRNDVAVTGRTVAGGEWTTVTFDEQFDDRPVVFTEVQSTNVDDEVQWTLTPSRSTVRNVTKSGFEVRVHEPDDETPAQQEVAFVAVEPGRSIHGDGIAEVATTGIADDTWQTVTFEQEFDDVSVLLAAVQTDDGTPVIPQYRNLDSGSVELSFRTTSGQFTGSATVNYLVLGDTDTFYASTGGSVGASGNSSQQVQQQWQEIIESADVIDASEMPDQPPGMAGARSSRFSTRASTAQNLLDIYPDAFVVFGHTHVPTVGNRYVNSGAWTSRGGRSDLPENCYIEIDSGDITVWNWQPTGREILFDP